MTCSAPAGCVWASACGWNAVEFEALNKDFHNRGDRSAEQVRVMRELWTKESVELGSLLMRMGHVLRRFQRERGMALPRPVAANSPLQSYFINADFAAVASDMFGERMPDQLSSGLDVLDECVSYGAWKNEPCIGG